MIGRLRIKFRRSPFWNCPSPAESNARVKYSQFSEIRLRIGNWLESTNFVSEFTHSDVLFPDSSLGTMSWQLVGRGDWAAISPTIAKWRMWVKVNQRVCSIDLNVENLPKFLTIILFFLKSDDFQINILQTLIIYILLTTLLTLDKIYLAWNQKMKDKQTILMQGRNIVIRWTVKPARGKVQIEFSWWTKSYYFAPGLCWETSIVCKNYELIQSTFLSSPPRNPLPL